MCGTLYHYVHFTLHPYYEVNEDVSYFAKRSIGSAYFRIIGNNSFMGNQSSEVHIIVENYDIDIPKSLFMLAFIGLLMILFILLLGVIGKVRIYAD